MTAPVAWDFAPRFMFDAEIQGPLPDGEGWGGEPGTRSEPRSSHQRKGQNPLARFIRIPNSRSVLTAPVVLSFLTLSFLTCGCFHTSRSQLESSGGAFAPLPPVFLSGPAGVLLTNAEGFSAHVVMKSESLDPQQNGTSGALLGRAGKLLFAPDPGKVDKKYSQGGFSFIWDVATGHGTVLSEALQAYAPVTASVSPTNLITHPAGTASGSAVGQAGGAEEAIVESADGSHTIFQIMRSSDLKGFPVYINCVSNVPPFTLVFSKIRLESPPADLFVTPNGFTKYESAEAMITELVMRQHNLRRQRSGGTPGEPIYDYRQSR